MDDIIKLIQELMSKKPTPKGGIADTVAGVEFIGKKLSKEQIGDFTIIGSKLTDASRFRPFDVRNVGRDNRYMYMRDYADELQSNFEKTLRFIKDNPDIRLTQAQKDNVFYNLGVYRRVNAEKTKLEKGYIDEGKNPEEIYKKTDDERPLEELPFVKVLERTKKTIDEFQKKVKETEDIFKPPSAEELSAGQIRYNKLYDGPGYTSGNSSLYRGYGSSFLPRLHEKGIIKLDDEIYQNLKQGKHHYGGADFFAPDPIRIWRKHFGDDVFKKLDNFDPDNEDIFQWLSRNNIQPTNRVGPKNALEYMNSTEIGQRLTDEAQLLNKYKDPASQGDNAKYYYVDKPDQRMERITYHGENIQGYETALQKMDPDAYNKYAAEFRQKTNDANVIPFNKDEGIMSVTDEVVETPAKAGEGKFTKAQVLLERLKNTIKENPNDEYVQQNFPNFIKEIEAKPELADDANVQEAFGLTDLSETTNQRLVEYPDGTLDFYTKGNQGGMESVQSLIDELGISQEEALRIKQLEPEDQILEITKLRTLKNKPEKAKGGRVGFGGGGTMGASDKGYQGGGRDKKGNVSGTAPGAAPGPGENNTSTNENNTSTKTGVTLEEIQKTAPIIVPETGVIERQVEKKLKSLIPADLNKDEEALFLMNLKEKYFPTKKASNLFRFARGNEIRDKEVNLLDTNLLDFKLKHPNISIENESGFIDRDKLKTVIDNAEIIGNTSLLNDTLQLSRNLDTMGKGITEINYTPNEYLNLTSSNVEDRNYDITGKLPVGPFDLSTQLNYMDNELLNKTDRINYDQNGVKGSYVANKDSVKRNLDLDKNYNIGNFEFGVKGGYDDVKYDDGYSSYSSSLTPKISYSNNIGDGIFKTNAAKEILEGGQVPNLSASYSLPLFSQGFTFDDNNMVVRDDLGIPLQSSVDYGTFGVTADNLLSNDRKFNLTYDYSKGLPGTNNYLEFKARTDPSNLRDSALFFGLRKEI